MTRTWSSCIDRAKSEALDGKLTNESCAMSETLELVLKLGFWFVVGAIGTATLVISCTMYFFT